MHLQTSPAITFLVCWRISLNDYLTLNREFVTERLETLDGDTLKIYLVLIERAKQELKMGLTIQELARLANVGTITAKRAIEFLASEGYINLVAHSDYFKLDINEYWVGEKTKTFSFSYKNTDENRLKVAERELYRLTQNYKRDILKERSGVTTFLKGDEQAVVAEIERDLGRGFTHGESYYLGRLISSYGPERVKDVWRRQAATAKNPMRALYALLTAGQRGTKREQREYVDTDVKYPTLEK